MVVDEDTLTLQSAWRQGDMGIRHLKKQLLKLLIEYAKSPENPMSGHLRKNQRLVLAVGDGSNPLVITKDEAVTNDVFHFPPFRQVEGEYAWFV